MKTEPDTYSIDDLAKDKKTLWDGVRNYQARNHMMKDMTPGDQILIYHSNTKPSGVVGLAEVSKEARPDVTAQDKNSNYYDAKASPEKPIWYCVEIKFTARLPRTVSLQEIKETRSLSHMVLVNNSRLSVQPVKKSEYNKILSMAEKTPQ